MHIFANILLVLTILCSIQSFHVGKLNRFGFKVRESSVQSTPTVHHHHHGFYYNKPHYCTSSGILNTGLVL